MNTRSQRKYGVSVMQGVCAGLLGLLVAAALGEKVGAAGSWPWSHTHHGGSEGYHLGAPDCGDWAGSWYWMRSPEQEQRVLASLYNRYCIRCHGVDGRGVWDIPDVPDLTNARWQSTRSDDQFARFILEGRGAVMPTFRGTLTLEDAWAMARYLRTFIPGTEASRPDLREPRKVEESGPSKSDSNKPGAKDAPRALPR